MTADSWKLERRKKEGVLGKIESHCFALTQK